MLTTPSPIPLLPPVTIATGIFRSGKLSKFLIRHIITATSRLQLPFLLENMHLQKTAISLVKSRLALRSPGWLFACLSPCQIWLNTQ